MIRKQIDALSFLTWALFDNQSLCCGILDKKSFNSYNNKGNLALHTPKAGEQERQNRLRLSRALNLNKDSICSANQVHGSRVQIVDKTLYGRGALELESAFKNCDAMIFPLSSTNIEDSPLGLLFTADCLPLIVFDPTHCVVTLIHAGWRGLANGIILKTLDILKNTFYCDPAHLLVGIGPAIRSCCYQVDKPVYKALTEQNSKLESCFTPDLLSPLHWGLTLSEGAEIQLKESGVLKSNIEDSGLCTCCDKTLFSWRREGSNTGRLTLFFKYNKQL